MSSDLSVHDALQQVVTEASAYGFEVTAMLDHLSDLDFVILPKSLVRKAVDGDTAYLGDWISYPPAEHGL